MYKPGIDRKQVEEKEKEAIFFLLLVRGENFLVELKENFLSNKVLFN